MRPFFTMLVVFLVLAVLLVPTYLYFLQVYSENRTGVKISSEISQTQFITGGTSPAFVETSFKQWTLSWIAAIQPNQFGFNTTDNSLTIFGDYNGYNYFSPSYAQPGVNGIEVKRYLPGSGINTMDSPYFVIVHQESTSNPAISIAVAVTPANGTVYDGAWNHVSTAKSTLEVDLRTLYKGEITSIAIRLTSDFNTTANVGNISSTIFSVGIYSHYSSWIISKNAPFSISTYNDTSGTYLNVTSTMYAGNIVSFQDYLPIPINIDGNTAIEITTRISNVDVALRVVVWTSPTSEHVVLLKTYDDDQFHTDVVSYFPEYFGFSGQIYIIEIGLIATSKVSSVNAVFRNFQVGEFSSS